MKKKTDVDYLPILKKRNVCAFCHSKIKTPNVCMSAGIMIICCEKHAFMGDILVNWILQQIAQA